MSFEYFIKEYDFGNTDIYDALEDAYAAGYEEGRLDSTPFAGDSDDEKLNS
jgi:hypothetical protein